MLTEQQMLARIEKLKTIKQSTKFKLDYVDLDHVRFSQARDDLSMIIDNILILDFVLTGKENDAVYRIKDE